MGSLDRMFTRGFFAIDTRKPSSREQHKRVERLDALSDRMVAGFRLLLATSALLIVCVDPSEPAHLLPLTYSALIFYTLYTTIIYAVSRREEAFSRTWVIVLTASDILICSLLISLSGGVNSVFFFFYFPSIIVACSLLGPAAGIITTLTCALLFVGVAYAITPAASMEWSRFLLRPIYLVVLGYILTTWSVAEVKVKRRLALLKEISSISNPRFGVDQTIDQFMGRIMEFFDADSCVFLQPDRETKQHRVRWASRNGPAHGEPNFQAPGEIEAVLPALTQPLISVCTTKLHIGGSYPKYLVIDPETQMMKERPASEARALMELLGGRSFMTVSATSHPTFTGHVCLSSFRGRQFTLDDAVFLLQATNQIVPVLEHIRLVDRMASDAADEERRRIARSVHDRVIQPYIGLQMGLKALNNLVQSVISHNVAVPPQDQCERVVSGLDNLMKMTQEGIEELRNYVYGLQPAERRGGGALRESLLRYAAKLEAATGMRITVENRIESLRIHDRLAAEIFQMVTEALSNVQRHTTATAATVKLEEESDGCVVVSIENEVTEPVIKKVFVPRSISARVEALGGYTKVSLYDGRTVVQVGIPT